MGKLYLDCKMYMEKKKIYTDREIIGLIQTKSPKESQAMEYLFKQHNRQLHGYLCSCSASEAIAEVITKEVFSIFWENVAYGHFMYQHENGIRGYLFETARRRLLAHQNNESRKESLEILDDLNIDVSHENENIELLKKILAQLGEKCRKILYLKIVENKVDTYIRDEMNYASEQVVRNMRKICINKAIEIRNNLKGTTS